MIKKKIVYIVPHLSTGGMPQYVFKQIESMVKHFDVYCIEWENVTGGVLVVQRNRIQQLLGDKLITVDADRFRVEQIIDTIKPYVVHLAELAETFLPEELIQYIYDAGRNYNIIETCHDSSLDVEHVKRYLPDKFLLVSKYQLKMFANLGVPCDIVEYPIEDKQRQFTREEALLSLGLDPAKKHVIVVGLFTPRKNQAEAIEYARSMLGQPVQFHFIGNQADNFKFYWEPLMKDFPSNCVWWNERSDVDTFYQAADLFLFTSKGNATDKETMPLVIREALSWKVPSLIYNLDVYLGYFNKYSTVQYLTESKQQNTNLILKQLGLSMTQDYGFSAEWDLSTQTMYYSCQTSVDVPIIVSVKEYKSDSVLWAFKTNKLEAGLRYWIVPIPKHVQSYEDDPNFTGTKFCVYRQDTGEQLYEQPFFNKFANIPTISLSNFMPYRINYNEFFVQKKFALATDKPYNLVVDVGANVGVFTEYMLRNGFAKQVVAVECDSVALSDLTNNFKNHKHVMIERKALAQTNEPITFYQSSENPVTSTAITPDHIVPTFSGVKHDLAVTVPAITLGELISKYGTIDLLKVDIEGAEYDILLNANPAWFSNINNLMVECHFHFNQTQYKDKFFELKDRLSFLGYKVTEINKNPYGHTDVSEVLYAQRTA